MIIVCISLYEATQISQAGNVKIYKKIPVHPSANFNTLDGVVKFRN
jgi:hypothetical protein